MKLLFFVVWMTVWAGEVERLTARIANLTAHLPSRELYLCQSPMKVSPWPEFVIHQLNRTLSRHSPLPKTRCPLRKNECLQALTVVLIVDSRPINDLIDALSNYTQFISGIIMISTTSSPYDDRMKVLYTKNLKNRAVLAEAAQHALGPSMLLIDTSSTATTFLSLTLDTLLDRGFRTHLNHPYQASLFALHTMPAVFVSSLTVQDYACSSSRGIISMTSLAGYASNISGLATVRSLDTDFSVKNTSKTIHAVWASDKSEMVGLLASVASALEVSSDPSHFVLHLIAVDDTNDLEMRAALECLLQKTPRRPRALHLYSYASNTSKSTARNLSSAANFVRYNLDRVLSSEIETVVWIDADTIVRADLAFLLDEFYTQQSKAKIPLAVGAPLRSTSTIAKQCCIYKRKINHKTILESSLVQKALLREVYDNQGRTEDYSCGFNAGVMVYNLKLWRSIGLAALVNAWTEINHLLPLFKGETQGPLLLATRRGNFAALDPSWNTAHPLTDLPSRVMHSACLSSSFFQKDHNNSSSATADILKQTLNYASQARIVHFTGNHKPWSTRRTTKTLPSTMQKKKKDNVSAPLLAAVPAPVPSAADEEEKSINSTYLEEKNHFFWLNHGTVAQACLSS